MFGEEKHKLWQSRTSTSHKHSHWLSQTLRPDILPQNRAKNALRLRPYSWLIAVTEIRQKLPYDWQRTICPSVAQ